MSQKPIGHIKNWSKFQHYKDRSPPWIKLQRELLDDFEYAMLPVASKALAPLLWLLASETTEGSVCIDVEWIAFRLRWNRKDVEDGLIPLIDNGFISVASNVLAECKQHAIPEGETEGEGETEKDGASPDGESPTRNDPVPYKRIAELYNQTMKLLPKVRKVDTSRKTLIRKAWEDGDERKSLEFWTAYFEECAADDFLNGKGPYTNGHQNWRPDFEYLMRGKTVLKVYEKAMTRMEQER